MSFYRKYRSQKFSDLIGQNHIRDTLLEAIKSDKVAHAYLFTGPRGTGKTSAARLIAKAVNCQNIGKDGEPCGKCDSCLEITKGNALDVIEIDAASNRGIDEIRALRENVKFAPSKLKKKIYIIDEVHMLTREAFNALLKTLEEPPKHLIFVLATTEAHKVPSTIISRAQRFDFHRVKKSDIIKNLKIITKAEKIEIDEKPLDLIASMAEGSHRDAITLFEQAASFSKKIDIALVESILGLAKSGEIAEYIGAIFNSNPEEGLKIAHRFYDQGYQLNQINSAIIEWLRKILLYLVSDQIVFEDTEENTEAIKKLAGMIQDKDGDKVIVKMIEIYLEVGRMMKDAAYPILPLEMATIKATALIEVKSQKSPVSADGQAEVGNLKLKDQNLKTDSRHPALDAGSTNSRSPIGSGMTDSNLTINEEAKPTSDSNKTIKQSNNSTVKNDRELDADDSGKVDDAAKVTVLEMKGDVWQKVISETKKLNTTLAALLRDTKPIGISGDILNLGVKFKFHKDKISENKNIEILEKAIEKATDKKLRVKCEVADLKKRPKEKLSDDDLIKAAEEVFSS